MQRWGLIAGVLGLVLQGSTSATFAQSRGPLARPVHDAPLVPKDAEATIELDASQSRQRIPVITALAFLSGGDVLATGGDDHQIRLWSVNDGRLIVRLSGHQDWVRALDFSPANDTLASAGDDGEIILWSLATRQPVVRIPRVGHALCDIAFSPDGKWLAAGGHGRKVYLFDAATGKLQGSIETACGEIRSIGYSTDGSRIAAGGRPARVCICDPRTQKVVDEFATRLKRIRAMAYSPDGSQLAIAGEGRDIELWSTSAGELDRQIPALQMKTFALTFCDQHRIATAGADNTIYLRNLAEPQLDQTFPGHVGSIAALAYEPRTGLLASGGFDTAIRVRRINEKPAADGETAKRLDQPSIRE